MKQNILLFAILFFTFQINYSFAQTQAEIESMMNDEKPEKKKPSKKINLQKELKKRSKELAEKEKLESETLQVKEDKTESKKIKESKNEDSKLEAKKPISKNEKVVSKDEKPEKVLAEKKTKVKKTAKEETEKQKVSADKKEKKSKKTPSESEKVANADLNKISKNRLNKIGDKLVKKGSYYNAIDYYNAALFKSKKDKDVLMYSQKLGEANYILRDYKQAEKYYTKAVSLNTNSKKYPLLDYNLANTYKYLGKYEDAITMYSKFENVQSDNNKMAVLLEKSRLESKGAEYALTLNQDDLKFKVENAGENVNGPFSDYGPELIGNDLFFSKIYTDKVVVLDDDLSEKEYSKIYYSEIFNDKFSVFQDFAENVNGSKIHVGNPSFASDGNTLYFTECTLTKELKSTCRIMSAGKVLNEWQKPIALNGNINLENTNNTQPQITSDKEGNEILFFVSDRTEGKGGKDIWQSEIDEKGEFLKAKNVSFVNTAFDDVSPFYHKPTNTLYFSSDGRVNIGGFDIYKVNMDIDNEEDINIFNLGYPLNSSFDDYDFVLSNSEELGFLTSNRKGIISLKSENCCDDIFVVQSTQLDLFVSGYVFAENETNREIFRNADLFLYNTTTNAEMIQIPYEDGKPYLMAIEKDMDYRIVAISDEFENEEINFSTQNIRKSDTLQYNLFLKKRELMDYVIGKVYYQFDMSKLREDAPDTLDKVIRFMNAYPEVRVEVGSHTDAKGTEEYNLALSERRSLSVKNYLINVGKIAKNRLENKWYGESKPVAPNTNSDGSDNPEGRDLNRRTEFKVIGTIEKKDN